MVKKSNIYINNDENYINMISNIILFDTYELLKTLLIKINYNKHYSRNTVKNKYIKILKYIINKINILNISNRDDIKEIYQTCIYNINFLSNLNILNNHNFRQNIIDSINDFKEIIHEFIEINKTLNNIDNNVFNDYVNGNSEDNDTYSYDENDHYTDDDITDELNEINIEDYNNIYEKMSYNSDDNM